MSNVWEVFYADDGEEDSFDLIGPEVLYSATGFEVVEMLERALSAEDEIICIGLHIFVDGQIDSATDEVRREIA